MRIALFLMILLTSFYASAQEKPTAQFFACAKDSDCTVIDDVCPNTWMAVATEYEDAYARYVARMRPVAECAAKTVAVKPLSAVCLYEHCRTFDKAPEAPEEPKKTFQDEEEED
jgi:hypothetical protein